LQDRLHIALDFSSFTLLYGQVSFIVEKPRRWSDLPPAMIPGIREIKIPRSV
jgi:hypothetical protein